VRDQGAPEASTPIQLLYRPRRRRHAMQKPERFSPSIKSSWPQSRSLGGLLTPLTAWERGPAPPPLLVVEVASTSTRRRDYGRKVELYLSNGIAEYWIIDDKSRVVTVAQQKRESRLVTDTMTWMPTGAMQPLTFDMRGCSSSIAV